MKIEVLTATLEQKAVVQNMARFYAYDMSRYCGHNPNWEFPENGLYDALDISNYWEPGNYAFVIRVNDELGGFVLIHKGGSTPEVNWDLGEFFIVAKFQGKGVGRKVAVQIFDQFPGVWEVRQMLDNMPAIQFWKTVIQKYTQGEFSESRKTFHKLSGEPYENIVLKFISGST